jgi:hypothetical protein
MTSLGCPSTVINDCDRSLRSMAPDLPRGFVTSNVEVLWPSIPRSRECRFPNLTPLSGPFESQDRCHASLKMDGPDASGFSPWKFPMSPQMTSAGSHTELYSFIENSDFTILKCKSILSSKCRIYKAKITYLRNLRCPDLRCWMIATCVPPEIHGCGFLTVSGFNRSRTLGL